MSVLEEQGRTAGVFFTAAELLATQFPDPRWAVPGLVPEGLTLLVGSPKLGKSWLCLGLAIAVASGGRAFGKVSVDAGPVLYAALEDTPRRLQSRLSRLLGDAPAPANLSITTFLPRQPEAVGIVAEWLEEHPDARLVVIDVVRKVRGREDARVDIYARDYDMVSGFKALADKFGVAVVLVHHSRKASDDDVLNEVSGSTGLTGAADAVLVMRRSRNTSLAELHITGRDVSEAEYGLQFDPSLGMWTLLDEPVAELTLTQQRQAVLAAVRDNPGIGPKAIADAVNIGHDAAKQLVRRMVDAQQLDTDGQGRYFAPLDTLSPLSPLSPSPGSGDSSDTGDTQFRGSGE